RAASKHGEIVAVSARAHSNVPQGRPGFSRFAPTSLGEQIGGTRSRASLFHCAIAATSISAQEELSVQVQCLGLCALRRVALWHSISTTRRELRLPLRCCSSPRWALS